MVLSWQWSKVENFSNVFFLGFYLNFKSTFTIKKFMNDFWNDFRKAPRKAACASPFYIAIKYRNKANVKVVASNINIKIHQLFSK